MGSLRPASGPPEERRERIGGRPNGSPVIGSAHIPRRLNRCCSVYLRSDFDPRSAIESRQASAEEHSCRRTGVRVVVGQTHRLVAHSVPGRHRLHQVPIPRPQCHPAD